MHDLFKGLFPGSIIKQIKYNTSHKFSHTVNCLLNHKLWGGGQFLLRLRSSTVWHQGVIHTEELKESHCGWESGGEASQASISEATGFRTVTLTRFSSGVPDRCRILGSAGSNPWPSGCRWASVPCQTKSGSAGRCYLWCFLWSRSLCWSEIKQKFQHVSYGKPFYVFSLKKGTFLVFYRNQKS